jgi:hypothetical protein
MEVTKETTMTVSFKNWSYQDKCDLISTILDGDSFDFEEEVTVEFDADDVMGG